eukprot:m51a1_g2111 hypothetical protein (1286) ;mRNA; r:1629251-1635017
MAEPESFHWERGAAWSEIIGGPSLPVVIDSLALARLSRPPASPGAPAAQPLHELWNAERLLRTLASRGRPVVFADFGLLLQGARGPWRVLSAPRALAHDVIAAHVRHLCAGREPCNITVEAVRSVEHWGELLQALGPERIVADLETASGDAAYAAAIELAAQRRTGTSRVLDAEMEICSERVFASTAVRVEGATQPPSRVAGVPGSCDPRCLEAGTLDAVAQAVASHAQFPTAPGHREKLVASAAVAAAAASSLLSEEEARALVLSHCVALAVPITRRALSRAIPEWAALWTEKNPWSERVVTLSAKLEHLQAPSSRAHALACIASQCFAEWNAVAAGAGLQSSARPATTSLEYAIRLTFDAFRLYSEVLKKEDAAPLIASMCHVGLKEMAHQLCCHFEFLRRALDPQSCDRLFNVLRKSKQRPYNIQRIQEFQMTCMGPIMHRCYGSSPDPRISAFAPDEWQQKVLDAIDSRTSALVVAATSLGKTAVCFHTVEKLLEQPDNGVGSKIVVYRSPRVGIFTRDYRLYVDRCDVLVTVPQILEMLLLSDRLFAQKLFFVVIDEVHCIHSMPQSTNDIESGSSWENIIKLCPCPFLALSATIGNPQQFHAWLDSIENTKNGKHVEYIHFDHRFTDQEFYIFNSPVVAIRREKTLKATTLAEIGGHGGLKRMHPLGTIAALKTGAGMKRSLQMVSLNPRECVEAFGMLQRMCNQGQLPEDLAARVARELDPSVVFPAWQLITRDAVYEYEERLKKFLGDAGCEAEAMKLAMALQQLKDRGAPAGSSQGGHNSAAEQLRDLLGDATKSKDVENLRMRAEEEEREIECEFDPDHVLVGKVAGQGSRLGRLFMKRALERVNEREKSLLEIAWIYGIGVHHSDLSFYYRNCIEVLFRTGHVQVVFATATLALGINMPIKTVIFLSDSPFLNPLLFRQMCGRAGRRSYDSIGKVVFEVYNEVDIFKYVPLMAHAQETSQQICEKQRALFRFSLEFLHSRGFIDRQGRPSGLTGVVAHLHYHQPANLIFCHLVSTGHIQRLCSTFKSDRKQTALSLLELLCHLFNVLALPSDYERDRSAKGNSTVVLPPLEGPGAEALEEYSRGVVDVFTRCSVALCSREPVEDDACSLILPVSGQSYKPTAEQRASTCVLPFVHPADVLRPLARSPFAALSGLGDEFGSGSELCTTTREAAQFDAMFLPLTERRNVSLTELRINAYALDFYKHGIIEEIKKTNRVAGVWTVLKDWCLLLKALKVTLERQLDAGAAFVDSSTVGAFEYLSSQFTSQFNLAKRRT